MCKCHNKKQRMCEILTGIVQPPNTFHNINHLQKIHFTIFTICKIVDTAQSHRILHNFSEYCAIPSSIALCHRVLRNVCNVIIYL